MVERIMRLLSTGSRIAIGAFLLWLANNVFDWVMYPAVMCEFGTWKGAIMMALLAIPFNYALIVCYDRLGHDLLGVESLKEFQESECSTWHKRLLRNLLARGRLGTFLFMSLYDPIPATLYMRRGVRSYNGLEGSDWWWFGISNIIANASWAILMMIGVVTIELTTGACAH